MNMEAEQLQKEGKHMCAVKSVVYETRIVVSRYYNTAGIRKKYHNIQTIKVSSINF